MYILTILFAVLFAISFHRDNRSLWNPPLLLFAIVFALVSSAEIFYRAGLSLFSSLILILIAVGFPLALLVGAVFLIVNGCILLRKEGRSKTNYLSLFFGILMFVFLLLIALQISQNLRIIFQIPILEILYILIIYSYLMFGFAFVSFLLYSILYHFLPKRRSYDFIIIHGAGLLGGEKVTPLLKRRVDKAVEAFYQLDQGQLYLIASGGQGGDEKISEAEAIANYLRDEIHFPMDRVLLEDQSRSTYENLLYSKQLGEERVANPRFLFVTNDYHVFRTGAYAKEIGMTGDGLGCKTASYYIPSAFIREFVAVCVKLRKVFLAFYIPLLIAIYFSFRGVWW